AAEEIAGRERVADAAREQANFGALGGARRGHAHGRSQEGCVARGRENVAFVRAAGGAGDRWHVTSGARRRAERRGAVLAHGRLHELALRAALGIGERELVAGGARAGGGEGG